MKTNLLFISALCFMLVNFVSCEQKNDVPPAPPYLSVVGTITDSENHPLNSIQVTVQLPEIFKAEYENDRYECYTEDNGQYMTGELSCWAIERGQSWPETITVSAEDTSGVYANQTLTVSVESYPRYADEKWKNYIDAKAQADFVLIKK